MSSSRRDELINQYKDVREDRRASINACRHRDMRA